MSSKSWLKPGAAGWRPAIVGAGLALVLGAFAGGTVSPAQAAPTVRYYNAAINPASVASGATGTPFEITITNDSRTNNNQTIQSATIQVPAEFTNITGISVTQGWYYDTSALPLIKFTKDSAQVTYPPDQTSGSAGNQIGATESVIMTITADVPEVCEDTPYTWITAAYQGSDWTNAYDLVQSGSEIPPLAGTQPTVTVEAGDCGSSSGFQTGDYCSYTQGGWGAPVPAGDNVALILQDNFGSVYTTPPLEVGTPNSLIFDAASNVKDYLPAGGTPGALTGDRTNPIVTESGVFGGQVTALRLNVDFNEEGIIDGTLGKVGDLYLIGTGTDLDGKTVAEILDIAELALGGGGLPTGYDFGTLNALVDNLNKAFDGCVPSDWAQTHLSIDDPNA